jgi:hypothetical protein
MFPADERISLRGERTPWFRNSDPRARPLACVDQIEVCSGDGKACWLWDGPIPKDDSKEDMILPPEFWLMFIALRKTNVINAIEKRLGRALIAQSKVSEFFSQPLGDYHWVDEVERFVATLHAMTQINSWSTASGEDSIHEGRDGYTLRTSDPGYGNLCDKFKFRPQGYTSILSIPFWFIVFSLPTFWLLSRKWSSVCWVWRLVRGVLTTSNEVTTNPGLPETHGSSQIASGSTNPAANDSERRETSTAAEGVAGPSNSTPTIVPLDSDQEGALLTPSRQITATSETGPNPQSETSDEIKWEPVIFGKIIEWIYILGTWLWLLLAYLCWKWPRKGFGWLKRTRLGLWADSVLGSLSWNWLSELLESIGYWWRECINPGAADIAGTS